MALVAGLLGIVGRFAGKLLTTVLGWASTLLFGKVPADRQIVVVAITFGSITWLALVAGVVVPDVGTFLLGFVPVPDFVDENVVRLAMLAAAVVLPLVIGAATLLLLTGDRRPTGGGLVVQVLRGYPLTALLGLSLGLLALIALARRIRSLMRRWSDGHVPVIVKPGRYESVLSDLESALDAADLRVTRRDAPRPLALPGRLLGRVAGAGIMSLVPDRLVQLVGENLEVGVYPADVAISGSKERVARARAALATRLTAADAYLTTTAETQSIEDRIQQLADREPVAGGRLPAGVGDSLAAIDADLARLQAPYDEWEVLYRGRLQTERDLRAGRRVGEAFPAPSGTSVAAVDGEDRVADEAGAAADPDRPHGWRHVVGGVGLALVALDALLLLGDRLRRRG